jgi:uncharacterized protein YdaU (DUF1376 family)
MSADVNLKDIENMPVNVTRMLNSHAWIIGARDKRAGFAMFTLMARAWHQVPAGSLPADDEELASLAFCSDHEWSEIKSHVLRGFTLCSDGRLYCKDVTEIALTAWTAKTKKAAYIAGQRTHGAKATHKPAIASPSSFASAKPAPVYLKPFATERSFDDVVNSIATPSVPGTRPSEKSKADETVIDAIPASEAFVLKMFDRKEAIADEVACKAREQTLKRKDVERVFVHWNKVMGKRAKLDDTRKKLIFSSLKDFSVDDLCQAIDGCKKSTFHMGQNDQRTVYNELSLILRNAEKIEGFMARNMTLVSAPMVGKHMGGTMAALDLVFGAGADQTSLSLAN